LAKQPDAKTHLDEVLFHLAATLKTLGLILVPFMPTKGDEILKQIGVALKPSDCLPDAALDWDDLPGHTIAKGSTLFPKIDQPIRGAKPVTDSSTPAPAPTTPAAQPAAAAPSTAMSTAPPQITIDEFMKIQLKTAKVLTAERVPRSEKLIKLQVDLGSEQRQIVAGIGKKYEPEQLVGRTIVIVANLKPAKLMGIESQGMVLAAGDAEVKGLVGIVEDVEPGTKVK
ncbi:MAG: methionine--tRNA ligase subunit beta, partial [Nitrospiraceae bacterium]